jgi:hypothetical protein
VSHEPIDGAERVRFTPVTGNPRVADTVDVSEPRTAAGAPGVMRPQGVGNV